MDKTYSLNESTDLKPLDFGKIYTVYQPIVDIQRRKIFGYEALTRGLSRIRQPQTLFRKAYEEGEAINFDLTCLKTTLKTFPRIAKDQLLFVNVEPVTLGYAFRKGKDAQKILDRVKSYGSQIVFEMTEGMKIRDIELVKEGFRFLKKYKCGFALDDVDGVDSKLLKLLSLKPDFIKIDMGLIQDIHRRPMQQKLVSEIIQVGKKKKFLIVAEGIENEKDFQTVKRLGIPYVQGFMFARPERVIQKIIRHSHLL